MNTEQIKTVALKYKEEKRGHIKFLKEVYNCDGVTAKNIWKTIESGATPPQVTKTVVTTTTVTSGTENKKTTGKPKVTTKKLTGLVKHDKYTYNADTDQYIVFLKSFGDFYICSGEKHRAMQRAYSRYGNSTLDELCTRFTMTRAWFNEYKTIMGWTHDMLPISNEDLQTKTTEEIVKENLLLRKSLVVQDYEERSWHITQEEAQKWKQLEAGVLDPIYTALDQYVPKQIKPMVCQKDKTKKDSNEVFLIGLSDLHFGGYADPAEMSDGNAYNIDIVTRIVEDYAKQIAADIARRNYNYKHAVVCILGDILHSLDGYTQKGTKLETDVVGPSQFMIACESLLLFLNRMVEIFGKVEVYATKGNHAGPYDMILNYTLKKTMSHDDRIKFTLFTPKEGMFRINNTAVYIDHGNSDSIENAQIPKAGVNRENYLNKRFLNSQKDTSWVKSRLFIQGDKHHFEFCEYATCDFCMFSSPSKSKFTDQMNLNSRPRQNCLVISDNGVSEQLSYYFDKELFKPKKSKYEEGSLEDLLFQATQ